MCTRGFKLQDKVEFLFPIMDKDGNHEVTVAEMTDVLSSLFFVEEKKWRTKLSGTVRCEFSDVDYPEIFFRTKIQIVCGPNFKILNLIFVLIGWAQRFW